MFTILTLLASRCLYSRGYINSPSHPRANPPTPSPHRGANWGARSARSLRLCKLMGSRGQLLGVGWQGSAGGLQGSSGAGARRILLPPTPPRRRVQKPAGAGLVPRRRPARGPAASSLAQVARRGRDVLAPPLSRGILAQRGRGPELRAAHSDPARARPLASRSSAPASAAPASGFCSAATRAASAA